MARQSFKFFTPRDKPKKRGARQHKKNKNKHEKRQKKQTRYKGQGKGWHSPKISYIGCMKEKIITIKVDGANQGQWSNLLLELNLIKKAWKSYGVNISLKAPGLKNVIEWGNKVNDYTRQSRRPGKRVQPNQRPRT